MPFTKPTVETVIDLAPIPKPFGCGVLKFLTDCITGL